MQKQIYDDGYRRMVAHLKSTRKALGLTQADVAISLDPVAHGSSRLSSASCVLISYALPDCATSTAYTHPTCSPC